MEEVWNDVSCLSWRWGGKEFGTEAKFEYSLVPQQTRFPGISRLEFKIQEISWMFKSVHGREFLILMLLYRKNEREGHDRQELANQNCHAGTKV